MSKHKPKLSEALQSSLTSIQEAWQDWEKIPQRNLSSDESIQSSTTMKPAMQEKLKAEVEPLLQQLKDQLDTFS